MALHDGTRASRARPRLSRGRGPRHAVLEVQVQIAVTAAGLSRGSTALRNSQALTAKRQPSRDLQVRVSSRSLILRHIWKKFFTTNSQIFKQRTKKLG